MRLLRTLWALVVGLLLAAGAAAQLPAPGHNAIAVELIAESPVPKPGSAVTLALVMKPDPGWHGYWQNPGDAGVESTIDWRLPRGVTAGALRYPVPQRLLIAGLMNYVYERDFALLVSLQVPPGLTPGEPLPIRGTLRTLACTEVVCVPQTSELALDLTVGDGGRVDRLVDSYRRLLPRPLGGEARFERAAGRLRIAVPFPAATPVTDPYFYPLTRGAIDYAGPQAVNRNGDVLVIETRAGRQSPQRIEGVIAIGEGEGLTLTAAPGPVPPGGTPIGSQALPGAGAVFAALTGALIGGLLLNIMPCVFPILSLKALSLAQAGGDETAVRREAVAYSAGVVLVCLALGGLLLLLRAGGTAVGWAFQLQDPRVIILLLVAVTAIALNLAGLFELPALGGGARLAGRGGVAGAFWTGALAAFVATPCTGPFMGVALGAALILSGAAALAVFAGLGLGMALPFLLIGFVPAARRLLPRPGPWLGTFRRWMAIPMLFTALGLAWVLGRQAGVGGMIIGLSAVLIVALSLWWLGLRQDRGRGWLALAPAVAATLAAILLVPMNGAPAAAQQAPGLLAAEPFSEARLAALRGEGRAVFVYFTADWCLTCKVNEQTAIDRREVAEAFARHHVAVLVGDWTDGEPEIGRFLEKQGRSGVPLYLYYAPGRPADVLPQLLTAGGLTALVE